MVVQRELFAIRFPILYSHFYMSLSLIFNSSVHSARLTLLSFFFYYQRFRWFQVFDWDGLSNRTLVAPIAPVVSRPKTIILTQHSKVVWFFFFSFLNLSLLSYWWCVWKKQNKTKGPWSCRCVQLWHLPEREGIATRRIIWLGCRFPIVQLIESSSSTSNETHHYPYCYYNC